MIVTGRSHKLDRRPKQVIVTGLPYVNGVCTPRHIRHMGTQRMSLQVQIRMKLERAFRPERLEITNESALHAGHHGSPGTGESHFRVSIVSASFAGKSRIARHRLVNETLAEELRGGVHALAITALAPGEKTS
jgi:BolA protein